MVLSPGEGTARPGVPGGQLFTDEADPNRVRFRAKYPTCGIKGGRISPYPKVGDPSYLLGQGQTSLVGPATGLFLYSGANFA